METVQINAQPIAPTLPLPFLGSGTACARQACAVCNELGHASLRLPLPQIVWIFFRFRPFNDMTLAASNKTTRCTTGFSFRGSGAPALIT